MTITTAVYKTGFHTLIGRVNALKGENILPFLTADGQVYFQNVIAEQVDHALFHWHTGWLLENEKA